MNSSCCRVERRLAMKTSKQRFWVSLLTITALCLAALVAVTGCGIFTSYFAAGAGVEAGWRAVDIATGLVVKGIKGLNESKSTIGMQPEAPSELTKAKAVVIRLNSQGSGGVWGTQGQTGLAILGDSFAAHLINDGYDVTICTEKAPEDNGESGPSTAKTDTIPQHQGDLSFYCSIATSTSTDHDGGWSDWDVEWQARISSASLRVVSNESGKVILTATICYERGKTPQEVGEDLSTVIRNARQGEAS
jgi:hypothetical protein